MDSQTYCDRAISYMCKMLQKLTTVVRLQNDFFFLPSFAYIGELFKGLFITLYHQVAMASRKMKLQQHFMPCDH